MTTNSGFLKLKSADFWKGLILAVITAVFTAGYAMLTTATDLDSLNWQPVILAAMISFVAYLTKNLFSNSEGQILKAEPK